MGGFYQFGCKPGIWQRVPLWKKGSCSEEALALPWEAGILGPMPVCKYLLGASQPGTSGMGWPPSKDLECAEVLLDEQLSSL